MADPSTSTSPPTTFRERSPSLANGTDTTTFFPDADSQLPHSTSNDEPSSLSHPPPSHPQSQSQETHTLTNPDSTILITLTYSPLSLSAATTQTRSPTAGATVLFVGTTRSYFRDPTRPVTHLTYQSYAPLALRTLLTIATQIQATHSLERVYLAHRLGDVRVGEESIVVAVSAGHRGPAWKGGEELLERVKERAEIWKREWFVDGGVEVGRDGERGVEVRSAADGDGAVGVWRDNRESDAMGRRKGIGREGNV